MVEALSEKLKRATSDRALLIESAKLVSTRTRFPDMEETKKSIKDLTKTRGNVGKNLVKTGTVLIAFPEPVTGVVGVPLLAAGLAMNRRSSMSLKELHDSVRETLSSLASVSSYFS